MDGFIIFFIGHQSESSDITALEGNYFLVPQIQTDQDEKDEEDPKVTDLKNPIFQGLMVIW